MKIRRCIKVLSIAIGITFIMGCEKEELIPNLGFLEVNLTLADGLSNITLNGVKITITNNVDNSELTEITTIEGKVVFDNLPIASYNLVANKTTNDIILVASKSNIQIKRQEIITENITINASNTDGGLVIKEVYYVGSNYVTLFKDQFIEIFNNASETLYADGIYIANLGGNTGESANQVPIKDVLPFGDFVYADLIDKIPGDGDDYPIAPGKSIVIALNAINYKENSTDSKDIDNTDVTLERYSVKWLEDQGRSGNTFFDLDNPQVPNMDNVYIFDATNFYRFYIGGAGIALISADANFSSDDIVDYQRPGFSSVFKYMKVPVDQVLDALEILANSQASEFKRFPDVLDAGFNFINADNIGAYSGKSTRRKKDENASIRFGRVILQDSNNSTIDFETIDAPDKYGYNQ
ncbi:MAG: hypothetical protein ACI9JT_000869 [Polaribacter sp.]|jgi:hypothetical protein